MDNTRKLFTAFLLSVIGCGVISAQTLVKVSGVVTSADDGQPMIGVAVMNSQGAGVITSLDGEYTIEATSGTKLTFSSIGFLNHEVVVPD